MYVDGFREAAYNLLMLTEADCRAARALLDWSQTDLAKRSNLGESSIRDFEKGRRTPGPNNLAAVRRALEDGGVEFLEGGGVRLRKPTDA